jgi:hypothetical protein
VTSIVDVLDELLVCVTPLVCELVLLPEFVAEAPFVAVLEPSDCDGSFEFEPFEPPDAVAAPAAVSVSSATALATAVILCLFTFFSLSS